MAVKLALPHLRDRVVATFAQDGTLCPVYFGWREVNAQVLSGRRIVMVPGDPDGNMGRVGAPLATGKTPTRDLGQLSELCTVHIHATDSNSPEDEEAQYHEARLLFDAFFRALYHARVGRFDVSSAKYLLTAKERRYGLALRVVLSVSATLPDSPLGAPDYYQLASPFGETITAELDVTAASNTQTIEAPP